MVEKANKYICTKKWARNQVGDVIDRYLFNKYPVEVQEANFKPVVAEKVTPKPAVVSTPKFVAEVAAAK